MPRASANTQRSGDFTGKQKAELEAQAAAEKEAAAKQMAMATAAESAEAKETVDLAPRAEEPVAKDAGEVTVTTDVDVATEMVKFRVNETLEMVTIGHGQHYDFEKGREYRAPRFIRDHLEEKGLVWH